MRKYLFLMVTGVLLLNSCRFFKHKPYDAYEDSYTDSMAAIDEDAENYNYSEQWTGPNEILFQQYKAARTQEWDLIHTDLNLSFQFEERTASGQATLTLKPHWYATDSLVLDAKNMAVSHVLIIDSAQNLTNPKEPTPIKAKALPYRILENKKLWIQLPQIYKKGAVLTIQIHYTANLYEAESTTGTAITSDRGLYFINHDLSDPTKPRQIWSQGETESNSHWFPTIDAPNQKTTLRIKLHVPDTMITLSNGLMTSSKQAEKGFRDDVWEQKQPHAPYLTMIGIGNWAVIKDKWRNKEVNYLVEKQYAPYADLIFGQTPQMMEFFSNYTGVPFVWDKYSQVVVRDFVSGAMENTSATVHMEQLQHTAAEHFDETYEDYISHELFHQWFGDLVTAESWANITLNESFATYGQYLWREFHYGRDNADWMLDKFRDEYLNSYSTDKKLVRYEYEYPDQVFDNVSYQKGACILHMLRQTIGDEAFREGLKNYLNHHAYESAEVADLRLEFEKVTGTDLQWFFNQWYLDNGHPELQQFLFEDNDGRWYLQLSQLQDSRNTFAFPLQIQWADGLGIHEDNLFINSRTTLIPMGSEQPKWYITDAKNTLLANFTVAATDIDETAKSIGMLHAAAQNCKSQGIIYRLFNQACSLADVDGQEPEYKAIIDSFIPFFHLAARSHYDYTVTRALEFSNAHSEFPFFSGDMNIAPFKAIAKDLALQTDTRVTALYALRYRGASQNTLLEFTHDTSIQLSEQAIDLLEDSSVWYPYAVKIGLSESRSPVAASWARKLILESKFPADDVMFRLSINQNVSREDYYNLCRGLFYYVPDDDLVNMLSTLSKKLQGANKADHRLLLHSRIQNQIVTLNAALPHLEIEDPNYASKVRSRIQGMEAILAD